MEAIVTILILAAIGYFIAKKVSPNSPPNPPSTKREPTPFQYVPEKSYMYVPGKKSYKTPPNSVNAEFNRIRKSCIGNSSCLKDVKGIKGRIMRTGR